MNELQQEYNNKHHLKSEQKPVSKTAPPPTTPAETVAASAAAPTLKSTAAPVAAATPVPVKKEPEPATAPTRLTRRNAAINPEALKAAQERTQIPDESLLLARHPKREQRAQANADLAALTRTIYRLEPADLKHLTGQLQILSPGHKIETSDDLKNALENVALLEKATLSNVDIEQLGGQFIIKFPKEQEAKLMQVLGKPIATQMPQINPEETATNKGPTNR